MTEDEVSTLFQTTRSRYRTAKKDSGALPALSRILVTPIQDVSSSIDELACRPSCAHCCHLRVVAYPFEIVSIYFYLVNNLNSVQLLAFKERLSQQYQRISAMTREEHFTTNIQCPLLLEDNCIAYPARPIACAGYHSLSEPACRDSYDRPEVTGLDEGGIPIVHEIQETQALLNGVAAAVLNAEHDDDSHYELIASLHQIFKDPKLIPRLRNGRKAFIHEAG